MAEFPRSHYAKNQIVKAGAALAKHLPYHPERMPEYIEIFRIAWDWRNSHAFPMRVLRYDLWGKLRRNKVRGITAARLKRMVSIRKKLSRLTTTLVQMDDLGGCRAIVESIDQVELLVKTYRDEGVPHVLRKDRSYIELPKPGGYRSHHLVLEFRAQKEEERIFEGRRIEIQIRTRLQHAWATAVEAVGLVRNEDLKAGEGSQEWLRLFELVSSEFAEAERCALVPGAPERRLRVEEIQALNERLEASASLKKWNDAIKQTETYIAPGSKYFLIQYDNDAHTVDVRGYDNSANWPEPYSSAESKQSNAVTTVLVEVDKVDSLREAYPNYFLDMSLFADNLRRITMRQPLRLSHSPEDKDLQKAIVRGVNAQDLSWLKNWRPMRRS